MNTNVCVNKIFIVGLLLFCLGRSLCAMDAQPQVLPSVDPSDILASFSDFDDAAKNNNECPICFEPLTHDSRYQLSERINWRKCLPDEVDAFFYHGSFYKSTKNCGHALCKKCLAEMISRGNGDVVRCPLCRAYILGSDLHNFIELPQEQLNAALFLDDYKGLQHSLRHGANTYCRDERGYSPLYVAVQRNDFAFVIELLRASPADSLSDYLEIAYGENQETVLMLAARLGFSEIIKLLLSVISEDQRFYHVVKLRTKFGDFALSLAVDNDKLEAVSVLVSMIPQELHYDCLNARRWGLNVIHRAAFLGSVSMINTFLNLVLPAEQINLLNERVNSVLSFGDNGMTALHLAAQHGQSQMVKSLVAHGADLIARDGKGRTPFDVALTQEIKNLLRFC